MQFLPAQLTRLSFWRVPRHRRQSFVRLVAKDHAHCLALHPGARLDGNLDDTLRLIKVGYETLRARKKQVSQDRCVVFAGSGILLSGCDNEAGEHAADASILNG